MGVNKNLSSHNEKTIVITSSCSTTILLFYNGSKTTITEVRAVKIKVEPEASYFK